MSCYSFELLYILVHIDQVHLKHYQENIDPVHLLDSNSIYVPFPKLIFSNHFKILKSKYIQSLKTCLKLILISKPNLRPNPGLSNKTH